MVFSPHAAREPNDTRLTTLGSAMPIFKPAPLLPLRGPSRVLLEGLKEKGRPVTDSDLSPQGTHESQCDPNVGVCSGKDNRSGVSYIQETTSPPSPMTPVEEFCKLLHVRYHDQPAYPIRVLILFSGTGSVGENGWSSLALPSYHR